MLRIDDTDSERSEEKYVDAIKRDLGWLGLGWDIFTRQSERMDSYAQAVDKLKSAGRLYECYETQQELEIKRKMLLGRGLPPIYDRSGMKLTDEQKQQYQEEGRKPHYRFLLEDKDIDWEDEIRGHTHFEGKNLSDPILIRENGMYTYMLPSTVDDIEFAVTHILRGEDHVSNTAIQLQLFEALGGAVPQFAHNALIKTREGKLSKRKGGGSLQDLREDGILPIAVSSFLAKIGTSDSVVIHNSLDELVAEFDIGKFGRNPTIYSIEDIERLNIKLIHTLSFQDAKGYFEENGLSKIDEDFWLAVRPNIAILNEVKQWWDICHGDVITLITEDNSDFIRQASELLPEGEWDENTWGEWTKAVQKNTGRKGRGLFMPLRQAITGMSHGPELKTILPLIGRKKVLARLQREQF